MSDVLQRSYPRLRLPGVHIRNIDMQGTVLRNANLARANATGADFRNADMLHADLAGTILRGANLSGARNLTVEQLRKAVIDDETILPDYIDRAALRNG